MWENDKFLAPKKLQSLKKGWIAIFLQENGSIGAYLEVDRIGLSHGEVVW